MDRTRLLVMIDINFSNLSDFFVCITLIYFLFYLKNLRNNLHGHSRYTSEMKDMNRDFPNLWSDLRQSMDKETELVMKYVRY